MILANTYHRRKPVTITHRQGPLRDDGSMLSLRPNAVLPRQTAPARDWAQYERPTAIRWGWRPPLTKQQ